MRLLFNLADLHPFTIAKSPFHLMELQSREWTFKIRSEADGNAPVQEVMHYLYFSFIARRIFFTLKICGTSAVAPQLLELSGKLNMARGKVKFRRLDCTEARLEKVRSEAVQRRDVRGSRRGLCGSLPILRRFREWP